MMPHSEEPLEHVAQLIHPGTKIAKAGGSRLNIQCIAHEDRSPSLTIWHDVRGKLAFNCHAGCTHDQIVDRLPPAALDYARSTWGVEATVVQFPTSNHKPLPPVEPETNGEIHYPYVTEDGEVAYVVIRRPGKRITQAHYQKGHLKPGRGSAELIPYRLPDVIAANQAGDTIYIVEGEKDADNLAALGLTATCNVGGAGKWTDNLTGWFVGANVVMIPDNDQPGLEHALSVSLAISEVTDSYLTLELPGLPEKGDVSDWIEAGGTREQLEQLVAEATDTTEPDEWQPLDLGPIIDGDIAYLDPPPTVLWRNDEAIAFFYPKEINWMSGEPESGKSWIAQIAAAQELIAGHQVTYIDFEDTPGRIVRRFQMLGVPDHAIRGLLHYVRPSVASSDKQLANLRSSARSSSLAVVDGVTDLHIIHGKDPETNRDVAEIVQRILRPLADAGPATLPIDHVTKNKETRGRYAIGGQHKLAAVRGASYGVEVVTPFARGEEGEARVYITKDRPGHIRGLHTIPLPGSKHMAFTFRMWDHKNRIEYSIDPPVNPEDAIKFRRQAQILEAVNDLYIGNPLSKNDIVNHPKVTGSKGDITSLIDQMVEGGLLHNSSETVHARIHPKSQAEWG